MDKISSLEFYKTWLDIINQRKGQLLDFWQAPKFYTNYIISDEDSVMREVANKMGLLCYAGDYYSIDTILYNENDRISLNSPNKFWFRNIRIAFEHENYFRSGLYQEVCHLLITNCDLRVFVTYPNGDVTKELNYLHEIITGNRQSKIISADESFLLIFGYEKDFIWEGFVYKQDQWERIL